MKQISFWAKEHPWTSRLVIITCYVGLNITGIITGHLLNELSVNFSPLFLFIVVILFLAGFMAYPSHLLKGKTLSKEAFYVRQKSCDFILMCTTFLMIVYYGNHQNDLPFSTMSQAAIQSNPITPTEKTNTKAYKSFDEFRTSMKNKEGKLLKWKERKKLLKSQVSAIKKAPELSKEMKFLLTLLCILAANALIYLALGLGCSLACSGAPGLGLLVMYGGLTGIIFLFIWAYRAIWGKKKKKKLPDDLFPPQKNIEKRDKDN
jgi:hypothetical protein